MYCNGNFVLFVYLCHNTEFPFSLRSLTDNNWFIISLSGHLLGDGQRHNHSLVRQAKAQTYSSTREAPRERTRQVNGAACPTAWNHHSPLGWLVYTTNCILLSLQCHTSHSLYLHNGYLFIHVGHNIAVRNNCTRVFVHQHDNLGSGGSVLVCLLECPGRDYKPSSSCYLSGFRTKTSSHVLLLILQVIISPRKQAWLGDGYLWVWAISCKQEIQI